MRGFSFFLFFCNLLILFSSRGQDFRNVELLDQWTDDGIIVSTSKARYNDCWGFVHNGEEYAVIGSTMGTHFFKITENDQFEPLHFIQGAYSSTLVIHRDFKKYKDYLYAVCDEGPSNLQIIPLSDLPNSIPLVKEVNTDFGRVHNIFIDTTNAMLYALLVTQIQNGMPTTQYSMRVFSLADPLNPQLLYTGPNDIPEVHDAYVRNNIAILNCGFDGMRVYDFTNPTNPVFKQNINIYQDQGYNHQGWLNPAGDVYIFGDETGGKRLKLCRKNGQNEWYVASYFGAFTNEASVPHNIMLDDQYAYVAYYNYGLRIFDYTSSPVKQIAFYDTYNTESQFKMNGAWGVYSQLPSKRILISDRQNGLFLFRFDHDLFKVNSDSLISIYPNPANNFEKIQVQINEYFQNTVKVSVHDSKGSLLHEHDFMNQTIFQIDTPWTAGVYFLTISYFDRTETQRKIIKKLVLR